MITFNNIGYMGRLGNQMFQYASLMGVAKKLGYEFGVPVKKNHNIKLDGCYDKYSNKWIPYKFDLADCFTLSAKDSSDIHYGKVYNESMYNFDNSIFGIQDNTDLYGYFQTEKYFEHIKSEVLAEFTFNKEIINRCLEIKGNHTDIVSLHFRRGDYMGHTNSYEILDLDYYQNAINKFNDKEYTFFIFSDDIEWCKSIFGESDDRIVYIEGNNQFIDMCLMSMCEHNIIANSTFSWWAAWLNKNINKKVIAPKKWFGPALYKNDIKDLYPDNWITI